MSSHRAILKANELMGEGSPAVRTAQQYDWYAETELGKAVLRYKEVYRLLRDSRFRNMGTDLMDRQGIEDGLVRRTYESFLLSMEGDQHAERREMVRSAFDRVTIDRIRPYMRSILNDILAQACKKEQFDFVTDIAAVFPTQIIAHTLGFDLSPDDVPFMQACFDFGYIVGLEVADHLTEIETALKVIHERVSPAISARRKTPRDDVISALVEAENRGLLSTDELLAMLVTLLFGGLDTTRRTLAKALVVLLDHPDQWRLLAASPEIAVSATEEILRYVPGTKVAVRVALRDLEFEGLRIKEGELVYAATGVANRDPLVYENPDCFDILRTGLSPLTFGGGPHVCLGAGLARAELQEALPILATRLENVRLDGPILWRTATEGSPGPSSIPLRVG